MLPNVLVSVCPEEYSHITPRLGIALGHRTEWFCLAALLMLPVLGVLLGAFHSLADCPGGLLVAWRSYHGGAYSDGDRHQGLLQSAPPDCRRCPLPDD